ncbi:MAG: palindromic element RPE4 domain-containing protein, partial [Rickettsia endosymbiont of Ixodes persulcatus]|nr:palindromic element RPE4 domain-containing protein [Rickettsia endosymbiont of Ixodes persulcatus]
MARSKCSKDLMMPYHDCHLSSRDLIAGSSKNPKIISTINYFLDTVVKPRYDKVDSRFRGDNIKHKNIIPINGA